MQKGSPMQQLKNYKDKTEKQQFLKFMPDDGSKEPKHVAY